MQTNLDVAAGLLHKYKMQVDCILSGQEAIDKIRLKNPVYNAIFMDHMMPKMDGIEAADAIRALGTEYAQKIPIIALTANAIHGTEKIFYEHGFQAFITKPIDIIELDSVIRKWVRDELKENAQKILFSAGINPEDKNENIIDIPGIDTEKGISFYGGDMEIYLKLLHSYAANTPGILEKLRNVSKETLPDYVITVHGLKGTSAGIGAEVIREAAMNLEKISRADDLNGVLAYNNRLIEETEIVTENIKLWLEQYNHNALSGGAKPRLKAPDHEVLNKLLQSCENYDMIGIDNAMSELESADYDEDAELLTWLKEKIDISEIAEASARLHDFLNV
jgi:CheY-like chemotaxis protein